MFSVKQDEQDAVRFHIAIETFDEEFNKRRHPVFGGGAGHRAILFVAVHDAGIVTDAVATLRSSLESESGIGYNDVSSQWRSCNLIFWAECYWSIRNTQYPTSFQIQ